MAWPLIWSWETDAKDTHYEIEIPRDDPTRPVQCITCGRVLRTMIEMMNGQCERCQ